MVVDTNTPNSIISNTFQKYRRSNGLQLPVFWLLRWPQSKRPNASFAWIAAYLAAGNRRIGGRERRRGHDADQSCLSLPPRPNAVSLCELAIAAGTTGLSVAVNFQDFPAHVVCQLWKYSMNFAGPGQVRHIRNQSDIRKLPEACGNVKLVLVHAEKLRTAASWAVEMASLADTEANSRPAIFSICNPGNGEDDPGVAMVLRSCPAELSAVARWFALGQIPTVPNWAAIGEDVATTPVAALAPVLSPRPGEESSVHRLREQGIFRSLVGGAAVLRLLGRGAEQAMAVEELALTTDDYEQVRRLLQSPW